MNPRPAHCRDLTDQRSRGDRARPPCDAPAGREHRLGPEAEIENLLTWLDMRT